MYKTVWRTLITSCCKKSIDFINFVVFVIKHVHKFWVGVKKIFLKVIFIFFKVNVHICKILKWNTNPAVFNNQNHILESWIVVAKSFMPHVVELWHLSLMKDSANNLKLCWRTNSFTYAFEKVLKNCKMPLKSSTYLM